MDNRGKVLYGLYVESCAYCSNCSVDAWEELENDERDAWQRTAEQFDARHA